MISPLDGSSIGIRDEQDELRPDFNLEFLIFLLVCGLLAVFFLLYFNRVFASIVSYGIRTWTWHKYRIYFDISALQISLLGGRIFFTGLRYHGSNETFLVQHGYVTWRYWFRRVREADIVADSPDETAAPGKEKNAKLPCRINVSLIGLEWFVYNRSPAYDSVLAGLCEPQTATGQSSGFSGSEEKEKDKAELRSRKPKSPPTADGSNSSDNPAVNGKNKAEKSDGGGNTRPTTQDGTSTRSGSIFDTEQQIRKRSDLPFLVQFFPIHLDCENAAAVIGNDNTRGILIVKADSVAADVDASETSTVDPYRQTFKVDFKHPVIEIRDNDEFRSDQAGRATGRHGSSGDTHTIAKVNFFRRQQRKLLSTLRKLIPRGFSPKTSPLDPAAGGGPDPSQIPGAGQWQGLSRYLDDQEQTDKDRWTAIEYAAENTLMDCPSATLNVYWDVVAKVSASFRRRQNLDPRTRINGGEAPAWGMHCAIRGGFINYGPWTDRRRADLQRVFFPGLSKDVPLTAPLEPGAWRVPTQFKLLLDIEDTVTVRIPFREQSKNWRWRGQEAQANPAQTKTGRKRRGRNAKDAKGDVAPQRSPAWLEIKIGANSTVTYEMDMLAFPGGYQNALNVDITGTELRSAVNQDILWRSGALRLMCDLSNPLTWNTLRIWRFNIDMDDLELYILRDHIFLLIDLIDDWTSGPPSEYLVFTPFKYLISIRLHRLKLYINVNDANIIDKPTAVDENAFLILSSPLLKAATTIPIEAYRPDKNAIPFDITTDTLNLAYHAPQWNTLSSFAKSDEIGHVQQLQINGKYHYNSSTSPANTDTLVLTVHGDSPFAYLYGFVVRFFLLLKDNYFGDHVHFRTLDEYQEQLQLQEQNPTGEAVPRPPNKKSNDLDVILSIKTTNPRVLLPTNIYSSSEFIQAELSALSVDLRFTNYYMDMELDLSPLSLSMSSLDDVGESPGTTSSNTQLFLDGLRVFGHRLFGLPPTEPTYLCNWDVSAGAVSGECSAEFLAALARGGAAFAFTFDDVENALVPYSSLVFDDVTFARVAVASIRIWVHVDEGAFLLSTDTIDIDMNDWARSHYSRKGYIDVPNVKVSCVNADSAARHKSRPNHPVDTDAYLQTDIHVAIVGRKFEFTEKRRLQQELVRREDQRTNRTPFLILPQYLDDFVPEPIFPPAQCYPDPPHPLTEADDVDKLSGDGSFSQQSHKLFRKSSFLSLSQSSTRSVRRSRSRHSAIDRSQDTGLTPNHFKFPDDARRSSTGTSYAHDRRHSALAQEEDHQPSHQHSSVAFSSPFFAPHYALDGVEPDRSEVPFQEAEEQELPDYEEFLSGYGIGLEDLDPGQLSEQHAQSSLMVDFPSGITAVVKPGAIRHTMTLISALQPSNPEQVLDSLQSSSMTNLFDLKKEREVNGKINEILLKLPRADVRFLNSSTLDCPEPSQEQQDQYDFALSKVALVTRTSSERASPDTSGSGEPRTSLHLRVGSAELSASERLSTLQEPQAAVMVHINDVMVSLGAKEVTYFDADVGSIVGSTASGKVEYLASLIHRTGSLATEIDRLVEDTIKSHDNCLKFFVYRLLKEGDSTQDPSFLIRPSAVLRSASEHLRTLDSWKLIMRMRQIWTTMDDRLKEKFMQDYWNDSAVVPSDAAELVISAFQRWRSWDLEDIAGTTMLRKVFGRTQESQKSETVEHPLLGAFRLGKVQFVLDPGPKENKIGAVEVTARVDRRSSCNEGELPGIPYRGPLTVLNLCCSEGAVNINWEICELAEDILRLYNGNRAEFDQLSNLEKKPTASTQPKGPEAYHVALEVMRGSVEVDTINLSTKTLSNGLKVSALIHGSGESMASSSLILNCDAVTSNLSSYAQLLGVFQLRDPSVFVSHETEESEEASLQTVKSTASSQNLKLLVKQDPAALMEVLDLVLTDEVSQIVRLQKQIPVKPKPKTPAKITDRLSTLRFNIALFLEQYVISVPLLQSLTYKISGNVARAACAANFGKELIFDFDVKENSHEMQIDVRNEPRSISLLQIPPTNGRISSQIDKTEHVLTVLSSVELIELDASAVYNLLAALNRPQISSAVDEVKEQSQLLQKHMGELFGAETKKPEVENSPSKPNSVLVYNIHLTLEGLQVSAITPLASEVEPVSEVLFSLDKVYLQAANRHEPKAPISKYPEVHLNMKQIGFDIRRGRRNAMRCCGRIGAGITVAAGVQVGEDKKEDWSFDFRSPDLDIDLSPETISTAMVVLSYLREKMKDLDTSRELDYLRKLRRNKPKVRLDDREIAADDPDILDSVLSTLVYNFEMQNIRACWNVASEGTRRSATSKEDLVLSIKMIEFGTRTKTSARLTIADFQLQMVPPGQDQVLRSLHSALLPEIIFNIAYVSTPDARRMAFQAVGQSLDLRLTSGFIVPAANLADSISLSLKNAKDISKDWSITGVTKGAKEESAEPPTADVSDRPWNLFGKKRLESLLVDADFAGAVVQISSKRNFGDTARASKLNRPSLAGKYGQFNADDSGSGAVLRSPGLAWKMEFSDNGQYDPTLSGEIKIDASSNILYPSVVPLILDIVASVQEVVGNDSKQATSDKAGETPGLQPEKSNVEDNILTADPSAVLGRMQLNLGLRICRQEFSLSCQPIARVAATTCFDSIYFTANTVSSVEQGNFFAISGTFTNLHASVQHVYSRESTGSFEIETVTLSFMNSKHVSGTSGVSAILNISPMKMSLNAKQIQDFLLFREIWYPMELRRRNSAPVASLNSENSQGHLVQRYQQVAATAAFPWTATISIAALDVAVDMGQAIGKSVFQITDFWVSSKKTSDWEQNLCLGFQKIGIDCSGRLSGFVALQDFKLRTLIQWPQRQEALNETPLVQASIGFNAFRLKAAFDYQAFLVADITRLEFLMYNVRDNRAGRGDRLVALFDGEAVQVFGTTTSASQSVALYQALKKLVQERKENFKSSLEEIEKFMRRKSSSTRFTSQPSETLKSPEEISLAKSPISLDTDVVVTLKALNLGVFPSTFSDHQVFKMEALNAYARFAASIKSGQIHSILKMTLGQLRIGLAGVRSVEAPKTLSEISVDDVVQRATGSRGGTILKVPQVSAVMETWQTPDSNTIQYIFKSAFEGKVEVGWNYSRISYIRGMWANHSKSLEQIWGRELPMAAVKITGVPESEEEQKEGAQQKITAEVNVPQSKYNYLALEPPVIETPQLRDMGEATPPLEWIGLHRERLPNLTHQIVIVSLLELSGEVEDAYSRILGAS